MWHHVEGVLEGIGVHLTLLPARRARWASVSGWWAIAGASFVTYIHINIYSHNNYPCPFFLFFNLHSFISTCKSYCVSFFFSFQLSPPSCWKSDGLSKWLCGAELPARLNHSCKLNQLQYSSSVIIRFNNTWLTLRARLGNLIYKV